MLISPGPAAPLDCRRRRRSSVVSGPRSADNIFGGNNKARRVEVGVEVEVDVDVAEAVAADAARGLRDQAVGSSGIIHSLSGRLAAALRTSWRRNCVAKCVIFMNH